MIRNFKQIEVKKDYVETFIANHHDNFIVLRVMQRLEVHKNAISTSNKNIG